MNKQAQVQSNNPAGLALQTTAIQNSQAHVAQLFNNFKNQLQASATALSQISTIVATNSPIAQGSQAVLSAIQNYEGAVDTGTQNLQIQIGQVKAQLAAIKQAIPSVQMAKTQNPQVTPMNQTQAIQTLNGTAPAAATATASTKAFNLTKLAQVAPAPMAPLVAPQPPVLTPSQPQATQTFADASELKSFLQQPEMDRAKASDFINKNITDQAVRQQIESSMQDFYESDLQQQEKLNILSNIWNHLPDSMKQQGSQAVISGELKTLAGTKMDNRLIKQVQDANQAIKKKAYSDAKVKKTASFNLTKTANSMGVGGHGTIGNVIMWGPDSTRIDSVTGMPISDWHIIERNKGWGLRAGTMYNFDYEAFWRENIMDKYSSPYRNSDGQWVGGYLEKRFETDRWVPEENKYQLGINQMRKPRPASLGSLESRMQDKRASESKKAEDKPVEKAAFNLSKMKKVAYFPQPMGQSPQALAQSDYWDDQAAREFQANQVKQPAFDQQQGNHDADLIEQMKMDLSQMSNEQLAHDCASIKQLQHMSAQQISNLRNNPSSFDDLLSSIANHHVNSMSSQGAGEVPMRATPQTMQIPSTVASFNASKKKATKN